MVTDESHESLVRILFAGMVEHVSPQLVMHALAGVERIFGVIAIVPRNGFANHAGE